MEFVQTTDRQWNGLIKDIQSILPIFDLATICAEYVEPLDLLFERNFLVAIWTDRKKANPIRPWWTCKDFEQLDLNQPLLKRYAARLCAVYNDEFSAIDLIPYAVSIGRISFCHRMSCYSQAYHVCKCNCPVYPF